MALNIEVLESSFKLVKAQEDALTSRFYDLIFTEYPDLQPLFAHTEMAEQRKKLFQSLALVVDNLSKPDVLTNALQGLGTRHVKYGVLPQHYPLIGKCLLKTLGEIAGSAWTPEVQTAWTDAYGAVAAIMLDGANYPPEVLNIPT